MRQSERKEKKIREVSIRAKDRLNDKEGREIDETKMNRAGQIQGEMKIEEEKNG